MTAYSLIASYGGKVTPEISGLVVVGLTGGSSTVSVPGLAQAGDLAVLIDFTSGGSISSFTPAGWNLIRVDFNGIATYSRTSYKILQPSDLGSNIATSTGTRQQKSMFIFRPTNTINQISIGSLNGQSTPFVPSVQNLNMTTGTPALIGIATGSSTRSGQYEQSRPVIVTDSSGAMTDVLGPEGGYFQKHKYVIYNRGSSPVSTNIGLQNDSGINTLQSFYIQIS